MNALDVFLQETTEEVDQDLLTSEKIDLSCDLSY